MGPYSVDGLLVSSVITKVRASLIPHKEEASIDFSPSFQRDNKTKPEEDLPFSLLRSQLQTRTFLLNKNMRNKFGLAKKEKVKRECLGSEHAGRK